MIGAVVVTPSIFLSSSASKRLLDERSGGDGFAFDYAAISPIITPLPPTLVFFATGLAGLGLLGWRRKKAAAG
jgi:hypothetical protein